MTWVRTVKKPKKRLGRTSLTLRRKAASSFYKTRVEDARVPKNTGKLNLTTSGKVKTKLVKKGLTRIGSGIDTDVRALSKDFVVKTYRPDLNPDLKQAFRDEAFNARKRILQHERLARNRINVPERAFTQTRLELGVRGSLKKPEWRVVGVKSSDVVRRVKPFKNYSEVKKNLQGMLRLLRKTSRLGLKVDSHKSNFALGKGKRVILVDVDHGVASKSSLYKNKDAILLNNLNLLESSLISKVNAQDATRRKSEFRETVREVLGEKIAKAFERF